MITKERIAELRRLCDRATPGPWRTIETEVHSTTWPICDVDDHDARYDDAGLIAAARTALPELLDEIERLREINSNLLAACETAERWLSAYTVAVKETDHSDRVGPALSNPLLTKLGYAIQKAYGGVRRMK